MSVTLIYGYWPNRPFGIGWCDLPFVLRQAGLAERLQADGHEVTEVTLVAEGAEGEELRGAFMLARDIAEAINVSVDAGNLPVVLVGSCSVAALAVAASKLGGEETRVLWCDAHADLHTPATTSSGLFEGMALRLALGEGYEALAAEIGVTPFAPAKVTLFGVRAADEAERAFISSAGLSMVSSHADVKRAPAGDGDLYLHLDMDIHDPAVLPASGFQEAGGPKVDDLRLVISRAGPAAVLALTGLDAAAVELGPKSDAAINAAVGHVAAVVSARAEGE